jgi:hypothetical protein
VTRWISRAAPIRLMTPRFVGATIRAMSYDVMVILEDSPGELARLGEVAGAAGVNIDGFAAFTGDGKGVVHVLVGNSDVTTFRDALGAAGMAIVDEREVFVVNVSNEPGAMGEVARRLADAGVNIDLAYTTFGGVRLVFGTDDIRLARSLLDG